MTDEYAAGFIDAEGSPIRSMNRKWLRHDLEVPHTHRPVLLLLRDHFGVGSVKPRKGNRLGKKPQWKWAVHRKSELLLVFNAIEPHLIEKRPLIQQMIAEIHLRKGRGGRKPR